DGALGRGTLGHASLRRSVRRRSRRRAAPWQSPGRHDADGVGRVIGQSHDRTGVPGDDGRWQADGCVNANVQHGPPNMSKTITSSRTGKPLEPLRPMTDDEVMAAAISDPDAKPLTPEDFKRMKRIPRAKII